MSKYAKGARLERELIKFLLKDKDVFLCVRGAGSKSYSNVPDLKIDVVCVRTRCNVVCTDLFQVKSKKSKLSLKEMRALRKMNKYMLIFNSVYIARKVKKGWEFEEP